MTFSSLNTFKCSYSVYICFKKSAQYWNCKNNTLLLSYFQIKYESFNSES